MNFRQTALKAIYPLLMKAGKWFGIKSHIRENIHNAKPTESFYNLTDTKSNGDTINFTDFKGKKVLLVNTASDCGYTGQLSELQNLHEQYKNVVIIGFPANDFKEQEKGTDTEIASFCSANFGVQFLLAKKSVVIKNSGQNPVFQWLTNKSKNGWNDKAPEWNFSKFLVDEQGRLTHYFGPAVSPVTNIANLL